MGRPLILKSELSPPMNSEDGGTISVYRCIGHPRGKYADTPIRRSGQEIRRYADTPVRPYADTPIPAGRAYRCIGVSVRSCLRDAVCGLSGTSAKLFVVVAVIVGCSDVHAS